MQVKANRIASLEEESQEVGTKTKGTKLVLPATKCGNGAGKPGEYRLHRVGLFFRHVADERQLVHLTLVRFYDQNDPDDKAG